MNMMSNSVRNRESDQSGTTAHAAAIRVVTYDSPYGKFSSAVTERIRKTEEILVGAELSERKTSLSSLIEEEDRLSTKLIRLEVSNQSRGTFVDLVPFRPEYSNLVEDLEAVANQGNATAQKILKEMSPWQENIDYWAGVEA